VLICDVKWARVTEFASGNGGLKLLLIVNEPEVSPKKRYNGCPLFENLVDIDTQDWKIRQWMDAIGGTGKDWDNCVTEKDDQDNDVIVKFGKVKADGLKVRIQTQQETYDGEKRAKVRSYLSKASASASASSTADGDEPPF
jgi:hypothetical protein